MLRTVATVTLSCTHYCLQGDSVQQRSHLQTCKDFEMCCLSGQRVKKKQVAQPTCLRVQSFSPIAAMTPKNWEWEWEGKQIKLSSLLHSASNNGEGFAVKKGGECGAPPGEFYTWLYWGSTGASVIESSLSPVQRFSWTWHLSALSYPW